jgi:hypothetical protein
LYEDRGGAGGTSTDVTWRGTRSCTHTKQTRPLDHFGTNIPLFTFFTH